jgi:hypothetical protein
VQRCDFRLAVIIGKNYDPAALRIYGCVVGSWDNVFTSVAGPNGKWDKGRAVQQLSNAGDHEGILCQSRIRLKPPATVMQFASDNR